MVRITRVAGSQYGRRLRACVVGMDARAGCGWVSARHEVCKQRCSNGLAVSGGCELRRLQPFLRTWLGAHKLL